MNAALVSKRSLAKDPTVKPPKLGALELDLLALLDLDRHRAPLPLSYDVSVNTSAIIQQIDEEIAKLRQARDLIGGGMKALPTATKRGPGRPKKAEAVAAKPAKSRAKRVMSAEGRARIAAAQKARWAAQKKSK